MLVIFGGSGSEWVKNAVITVCTIIGTIIAILTYNRAKISILQSEVAKQQTKKLDELLGLFKGYKELFLVDLYYEILICNIFEYAKIFGREFSLSDLPSSESGEGEPELDKLRNGWLILDNSKEKLFNDIHENMESGLPCPAKGFKIIDALYLTNSYHEFVTIMRTYTEDPFLPRFVSKETTKLLKQVDSNLRGPLAHAIDNNLGYLTSSATTLPIWPQAIFNQFNHNRVHHTKTIAKIISRLRRYLSI